jgi:hypothetical protein
MRAEGRSAHLLPDAHAFGTPRIVKDRRVLLVDDTWVTGARMRSAAAALHDGGAQVAGLVVVGRTVHTGAGANARWWSKVASSAPGGESLARAACCVPSCPRRAVRGRLTAPNARDALDG